MKIEKHQRRGGTNALIPRATLEHSRNGNRITMSGHVVNTDRSCVLKRSEDIQACHGTQRLFPEYLDLHAVALAQCSALPGND